MRVEFKKSFAKDLKKKSHDRKLLEKVKYLIENVEQAENINHISNLKKLKSYDGYYRIRSGEYRLGLIIDNDTVIFVRFLHRSEIYRYFP